MIESRTPCSGWRVWRTTTAQITAPAGAGHGAVPARGTAAVLATAAGDPAPEKDDGDLEVALASAVAPERDAPAANEIGDSLPLGLLTSSRPKMKSKLR